MTTYGVREHRPWDIERIAQDFLSEYWSPSERWVDIETIIERDFGILIDYTTYDSIPIVGAIGRRTSDKRFVIVVSESLANRNPNRYRFTLAQELAHFLLHQDLLEAITTPNEALHLHRSLTRRQYARLESEANRCAGAMLMPQHQFRVAVHDAYELWFGRMKSSVGSVIPDFLLKRVIDDLAKLYQVSSKAAEIRLKGWPIRLHEDILGSAHRGQPFIGSGRP